MRRAVVLLATLLAATPARAGGAEELAEARQRKAALEWDAALAAVARGLAAGDGDPARVVELHALAGELAAGLGREAEAIASFARALALRPTLTLPEGTSPTITAPFEAARAGASPLRVHAAIERQGAQLAVALIVDDDRLAMVAAMRARWDGGEQVGASPVIAPGDARTVEVAALDAHGNTLWTEAVTPPAVEVVIDHARPPFYARYELWGAVAVVSAIVGGVSAWRFDVAQDDWQALRDDDVPHDYSELAAVERRGRRHAFTANLTLALAGVTAVVSAALVVRERRIGRRRAARERAALVVTGGDGLGVALAGPF